MEDVPADTGTSHLDDNFAMFKFRGIRDVLVVRGCVGNV